MFRIPRLFYRLPASRDKAGFDFFKLRLSAGNHAAQPSYRLLQLEALVINLRDIDLSEHWR